MTPDWESVSCENFCFFWKEKSSLISLILNTKSKKHERLSVKLLSRGIEFPEVCKRNVSKIYVKMGSIACNSLQHQWKCLKLPWSTLT